MPSECSGQSVTHETFLLVLTTVDDLQFQKWEKDDAESTARAFLKKYEHLCRKYGFVSAGTSEAKMWLGKVMKLYILS